MSHYNIDKHCSQQLIALVRHIDHHVVRLADLGNFKDPQLWSALRRGYLAREGRGPDAHIVLTALGTQVLQDYNSNDAPSRKERGDLTERSSALLAGARSRIHRVA